MITGSSAPIIHDTIQSLQASCVVKDLGRLNYFLGVEAIWCTDGLYLTQRKYIADLLTRSKMQNAKPCSSPMASNCHLTSTDGRPIEDISLYRSVVGSMQYLAFTRPDLAFVVHRVSKFMHNPLDTHWLAVKRILRYLKHSISTVYSLAEQINSTCRHFSILIGLQIGMIADQSVPTASTWVLISFLGAANNKPR